MADDNDEAFTPGERAANRMDLGAERMHRRAESLRHRMNLRCGTGGGPPVFFGMLFLFMGAMFLLDNLNIIEGRTLWRTFWPLVFIGWGVSRLVTGVGDRFLPLLAIGGGSLLLANRIFDWDINVARIFWPLILIGFGVHILYRSWRRPVSVHAAGGGPGGGGLPFATPDGSPDLLQDASSTFRDSAMLGSIERRNVSQNFRGGDALAFMGSVEIDLRESRMGANEAVVDVSVMMGSVELRIPRDWTVESRVSAMLGSFEDLTDTPLDAAPRRLIIRGSAFMGSVEIRN